MQKKNKKKMQNENHTKCRNQIIFLLYVPAMIVPSFNVKVFNNNNKKTGEKERS
jgi:hypothetical protein